MAKRFRLSTLLLVGPLLALVVAMSYWPHAQRQTIAELESRVTRLENSQPLTALLDMSEVGVPYEVDHGMMLDTMQYAR